MAITRKHTAIGTLVRGIPRLKSRENPESLNPSALESSQHRKPTWYQQRLLRWRAGALASCSTALLVLIINISVTMWATAKYPLTGHVGLLFNGDCAKAKSINAWLQVAVNILSTVLLGASNYCMQCLSSPTREEIDRSDARGFYLHIGVPSAHIFWGVGRRRRLLWLVLAISALSLQFVYVFRPSKFRFTIDVFRRYNSVAFLTT